MIKDYQKLVRAHIPQIIKDNGGEPNVARLSAKSPEAKTLFKKKIIEEAEELHDANSRDNILEEAADLYQVILDYLESQGLSSSELEQVRKAKITTRGKYTRTTYSGDSSVIKLNHVEVEEE